MNQVVLSTAIQVLDATVQGNLPNQTLADGVYNNLHNICVGNLILSVAGLLPGLQLLGSSLTHGVASKSN